ncbi:MAG: sigma 54-interacting transcriptional regulator [Acidobacteriota bacterium]|nr:sigma 54-interacting transcriptional regulator [Acidobacteriota bacterium]
MASDQAAVDRLVQAAAWAGVNTAFGALGRIVICLDAGFRVLHASPMLDELFGAGTAQAAERRAVADLLGDDLFGPDGTLRRALAGGERREGWRALLALGGERPRLMSISAAPVASADGVCDTRIRYLLVMRPAEDEGAAGDTPVVFGEMVARSPSMLRIFRLVDNLRDSEPTVLLTGESGTGKEVLARAIHGRSPRWNGPFVAVNCAALPGELLETEMFGHVRGAFTGAVRDREGRFEAASGGTLFLDEIGDMPLPMQVKLLRVLHARTFERVGESRTRHTDARIIAATNASLAQAIAEGRFREDFYYRLRVVAIEVPPLRDRLEDIEPLAIQVLGRVCDAHGRVLRFSPNALEVLLRYRWPGNVRELENVLEYAVAVARGQTIQREDLPDVLFAPAPTAPGAPPVTAAARTGGDDAALAAALDAHHWRRAETARALGISRATLWRRMREAGLES